MPKTHCKPLPPIAAIDVERFWRFVQVRGPDECWPWTGGKTNGGYGTLNSSSGRTILATRVAYYIQNGDDPYPLNILHQCDNPPCCNGSHLRRGTQMENMHDMICKGRIAAGIQRGTRTHPGSYYQKLDPVKARLIRILHSLGWYTYEEMGAALGVTKNMIHAVVRHKAWNDLASSL